MRQTNEISIYNGDRETAIEKRIGKGRAYKPTFYYCLECLREYQES